MRLLILASLLLAAPSTAQPQPAAPVTLEYYYRIKWGGGAEFKRLYKANHQPLLEEMKRQGFILAMRSDEPLTHLAGGQRWDLRVTITYRDAPSAIVAGGAFDAAYEAAKARLYPDKPRFEAAEARRFGLLEEHWDVVVTPVAD